jgi:hypothetical protein
MKSKKMRWADHIAPMGEMRNVYKVLVVKPEGKRLLRRPMYRWEEFIWLRIGTSGGLL